MVDGAHAPEGQGEPAAPGTAAEPTSTPAAVESTPTPERVAETNAEPAAAVREARVQGLLRALGLPPSSQYPSELAAFRAAMEQRVRNSFDRRSPEYCGSMAERAKVLGRIAVAAAGQLTEHQNRAKYGDDLMTGTRRALATPWGKLAAGAASLLGAISLPAPFLGSFLAGGGARLAIEGVRQLTSAEGAARQALDEAHRDYADRIEHKLNRMVILNDRDPAQVNRFVREFVDGIYVRELNALFTAENGLEEAVQARVTWQQSVPAKVALNVLVVGGAAALTAGPLAEPVRRSLEELLNRGGWGTPGLAAGSTAATVGVFAGSLAAGFTGSFAAGAALRGSEGRRATLSSAGVDLTHEADGRPRVSAVPPPIHTLASAPRRTVAAGPSPVRGLRRDVGEAAPPAGGHTPEVKESGHPPGGSTIVTPPGPTRTPLPPPGGLPPPNKPPLPTERERILRNEKQLWLERLAAIQALIAANDMTGIDALADTVDVARLDDPIEPFDADPEIWADRLDDYLALLAGLTLQAREETAEYATGTVRALASTDISTRRHAIIDAEQLIRQATDHVDANPKLIGSPQFDSFVRAAGQAVADYRRAFEAVYPPIVNTESFWQDLVQRVDTASAAVALDPDRAIANAELATVAAPYREDSHDAWRDRLEQRLQSLSLLDRYVVHRPTERFSVDRLPAERQIAADVDRLVAALAAMVQSNPPAEPPVLARLAVLAPHLANFERHLEDRQTAWDAAPAQWDRILGEIERRFTANDATLLTEADGLGGIRAPLADPRIDLEGWQRALFACGCYARLAELQLTIDLATVRALPSLPAGRTIADYGFSPAVVEMIKAYRELLDENPALADASAAAGLRARLTQLVSDYQAELDRLARPAEHETEPFWRDRLAEIDAVARLRGPMSAPDAVKSVRADDTVPFTEPTWEQWQDLFDERLLATESYEQELARRQEPAQAVPLDQIDAALAELAATEGALTETLTSLDTNPAAHAILAERQARLTETIERYRRHLTERQAESSPAAGGEEGAPAQPETKRQRFTRQIRAELQALVPFEARPDDEQHAAVHTFLSQLLNRLQNDRAWNGPMIEALADPAAPQLVATVNGEPYGLTRITRSAPKINLPPSLEKTIKRAEQLMVAPEALDADSRTQWLTERSGGEELIKSWAMRKLSTAKIWDRKSELLPLLLWLITQPPDEVPNQLVPADEPLSYDERQSRRMRLIQGVAAFNTALTTQRNTTTDPATKQALSGFIQAAERCKAALETAELQDRRQEEAAGRVRGNFQDRSGQPSLKLNRRYLEELLADQQHIRWSIESKQS